MVIIGAFNIALYILPAFDEGLLPEVSFGLTRK
jgi:hypothetical protein